MTRDVSLRVCLNNSFIESGARHLVFESTKSCIRHGEIVAGTLLLHTCSRVNESSVAMTKCVLTDAE